MPKGRPRQLDVEQIRTLAGINCSLEEIAAVLRCSVSALRIYRKEIEEGRMNGRASLKRRMWQCAMGFAEAQEGSYKVQSKHLRINKEDDTRVVEETVTEHRQGKPLLVTQPPNTNVQIWLSKQMLGYSEKVEPIPQGADAQTVTHKWVMMAPVQQEQAALPAPELKPVVATPEDNQKVMDEWIDE